MTEAKGWQWWAGDNEEMFSIGPCGSKEEAIAEATGQCIGEFEDDHGKWKLGIHVVEARQDSLRLADWIRADEMLERAEEDLINSDRVNYDYEDGPWFTAAAEQEADLADRVKRACDEWQAAHGLVIKTNTFTATRNAEHIVVDHPDMQVAA